MDIKPYNNMVYSLGFDVSSKTIGWSVLKIEDNNISFVKCGYIKPTDKGNILDQLFETSKIIQQLIEETKPQHIFIENIIQFMKGKSTAKTIIKLTSYNRMIGLLSYNYLGHSPELYNVLSIRHGIKLDKKLPPKEDIPSLVGKHLNINFPYEYILKGKYKGKIKEESFDAADAVAVNLYGAMRLIGKINKKNK